MRLGKIAFAVFIGSCLTAQAEENVIIDLSVLDDISGSYVAPTEPLFPVLPKKTKITPKKIKKRAKPVAEQVKELSQKISLPEEKIVVVDVEPTYPEPDQIISDVPAEKKLETPEEKQPEISVASDKKNVVDKTELNSTTDLIAEAPALKNNEPAAEPQQEEKAVLLLDEHQNAEDISVARPIVFAEGSDELLPEQMAEIDEIIGRFKNAAANKIAIYSYNLDDGVDSFKKKRISLNRAVEIRSYLIKQGYKNFSIKVINVKADSDKVNTVELEEI